MSYRHIYDSPLALALWYLETNCNCFLQLQLNPTRCSVILIQSRFNTSRIDRSWSWFDTHPKMIQYKLKYFKIPTVWNDYRISMFRIANNTKCFGFVLDDFASFQACFREEVQPIQLAESIWRPPDKHDQLFFVLLEWHSNFPFLRIEIKNNLKWGCCQ